MSRLSGWLKHLHIPTKFKDLKTQVSKSVVFSIPFSVQDMAHNSAFKKSFNFSPYYSLLIALMYCFLKFLCSINPFVCSALVTNVLGICMFYFIGWNKDGLKIIICFQNKICKSDSENLLATNVIDTCCIWA